MFGFEEHDIGIFFFYFPAVVVVCVFFFVLIPDKINKTSFIVVGGFVLAAGAFLTGPSRVFGLPNSLELMRSGLVVAGIGKALLKSYNLVYIVKSGQDAFPEKKEEIERKAPLMVQFNVGIGSTLIPVAMSGVSN